MRATEITKLVKKPRGKDIEVNALGDCNLVLVDEGHRQLPDRHRLRTWGPPFGPARFRWFSESGW